MTHFRKFIFLFSLLLFSQFLSAQIGKSLVLDGCINYFEIEDNGLLNHNQVLSIECWIQPNCEDGNRIFLSKQWCGGEYGYYLSVKEGRLFWSFSIDGHCAPSSFIQTVNPHIPANQFSHVAMVHNESEVQMFINGEEVDVEQIQGTFGAIHNSSEPFRLGAYKKINEDFIAHYSGLLDEVRVWNIELTESLIQQRMNIVLTGNETGLILYLDMEENGQGASLKLQNQSTLGTSLNANPIGFNSYTPYISIPENYNMNLVDLGDDLFTCDDVLLTLDIDNYKNILWNTGATTNEINISDSGIYSVEVETELCKIHRDTVYVEDSIQLVSTEYSICENDSIWINNTLYSEEGAFYDTLFSNTGCDTLIESIITFLLPSSEYLEIEVCPNETALFNNEELEPGSITDFFLESEDGCDSIVSVQVIALNINDDFLGNDQIICNQNYSITSPNTNTFWNNGSISQNLQVSNTGIYYGEYIDESGCLNSDTIQIEFVHHSIYVPNAFSPNGDGLNDCFQPYFSTIDIIENFTLSIFSRWGSLIFQTSRVEDCWDGTLNGKKLNSGVFTWVIETNAASCDQLDSLRGDVVLLR